MAAPKRNPTELARDRARTAELYLKSWTQNAIAAELGVSQGQVSKDLKAVRQGWLESAVRDFDAAKAAELAKIDNLEREAWAAYERTVGPHTVTTDIDGTNDKGSFDRKTERTEHLAGNPAFLNVVMTCIDRRCKILGVDAPQKLEHTGQVAVKYIVGLSEDEL